MDNKIVTVAVTLVIGLILAGSVLAPTLTDAQKTIGPTATFDNAVRIGEDAFYYKIWNGEELDITCPGTAGTLTINGETLNFTNAQRILFASDYISCRSGGAPPIASNNIQILGGTAAFSGDLNLHIDSSGKMTGTADTTEIDTQISWFVYATVEKTNLAQLTSSTSLKLSDKDNVVVLGNIYTTGNNDTYYAYFDGELTVNEEYAEVSDITISKQLIDGYTDMYNCTVLVEIGEETFTPYFILAPVQIFGHEENTATNGLLAAVLVVTIMSMLVFAAGAILRTRD